MGWTDTKGPSFDDIEDQRMAENLANVWGWSEPAGVVNRSAGGMAPTTDPGEYGMLEHIGTLLSRLSQAANLKPMPQRSSLYDDNAPLNMEPIKEAILRNYTGEDYARGGFVGAESRGNKAPYYQNALPEFIPVVGGKSPLGGIGPYSTSGWADDLKGHDNPLPSPGGGHFPGFNMAATPRPGQRPEMDMTNKQLAPGMEDQFGDILTATIAAISAGSIPAAIRGFVGVKSGLPETVIMEHLAQRGITAEGLKDAIPNLSTKLGNTGWIETLLRGGTGITPESLRGFVGGFSRAKNTAKAAGGVFRGVLEPPPSTVLQKIVGEKTTKSVLPRELNEDKSQETLWGALQRLKGMGEEGLQSIQTPIRNIANTWGPNPETQKWLYDYVVRQRAPWNQ